MSEKPKLNNLTFELQDEDTEYGNVWLVIFNGESIGGIELVDKKYVFGLSDGSDPNDFESFFKSLESPTHLDLTIINQEAVNTICQLLQEIMQFVDEQNSALKVI